MALGFTEDEVKEFGVEVSVETNTTTWKKNEVVEIPVGEKATGLIVEALKKADRELVLSFEMLDTYEKFIPTE
jgi:hypothetical protein